MSADNAFHIEQTSGKLKSAQMIIALCQKAVFPSIVEAKTNRNRRMKKSGLIRDPNRVNIHNYNKLQTVNQKCRLT